MMEMGLLLYLRVSNKFSLYTFISARYAPPPLTITIDAHLHSTCLCDTHIPPAPCLAGLE